MNENTEKSKSGDNVDSNDLTRELTFAPSWARMSSDTNLERLRGQEYRDYNDNESQRSDRRPRRDDDRGDRNRRDAKQGRDRRAPRRDMGARDARTGREGPSRDSFGFANDKPASTFSHGGERGAHFVPREQKPALPLEVRVLPEQKALGGVIRRIQTSHRAFPLRDIAGLFLDNPASCLIRIEPLKDQQLPLFQCKICGLPALSEVELRNHVLAKHLPDFFDVEEVDCEPPTGVFNCVAKCGLSGELLGPPNHHSFNAKVQELLRTRYATLSEEAFRARIEMVRDAEVIEQWRQQCTKKKVYRRKDFVPPVSEAPAEGESSEPLPKAPPLSREAAEALFIREILPKQMSAVRHLVCTASVAMQTPSKPLFFAFKDALHRERRFPASLFFALRGAFRHRKLHLFRVNDAKGADFVMLRVPAALEPTSMVQTLKDVLAYIVEHPACTKQEMLTALGGDNETVRKELLVQLAWLIEKSHVIEFYNDVLSVPAEYPAFRTLQGGKQAGTDRRASADASSIMAEDEPVSADTVSVTAESDAVSAQAPEGSAESDAVSTPASETESADGDVPQPTGDAPAVQ